MNENLRDKIAEVIDALEADALTEVGQYADAVLAVVGPELDRLRAEVDALPYCSRVYYHREVARADRAEAERDDLRAQKQQLAEAITDLCWKATQYGETEDGDTFAYILPKGTVHRLIGAAQSAGIPAAFRLASVPEPSDSEPAPDAAAFALKVAEQQMCPNCVTPWKCNGPHIEQPAPDVQSWGVDPRCLCTYMDGKRYFAIGCRAHEEPAPDADRCTGASDCGAPLHVHGCYADMTGPCDDPADHAPDADREAGER